MDNVDKLLLELKRVLSVVDDNYITKIALILKLPSEYDNLFYHYADTCGVDRINAKSLCINKINGSNKDISSCLFDYYAMKDISSDSAFFTDLYKIIDDNLEYYYNDVDELQELIENNKSVIDGLNELYGINKNEEINYIKLYLSSLFYSYMATYINIVDTDDYYVDEDTRFIDIYNSLNDIDNINEVISIFNSNIDEILDIFYIYSNLDKEGKDRVHANIINKNKINNVINICPFSIMMYKRYFSMYYNNEELKCIEIGRITIEVINDMIKNAYDCKYNFNDVIKNTVNIIKSSSMDYNIDKWLKYLCSNVYENIKLKDKYDKDESSFIKVVNDNTMINSIFNYEYLVEYIVKKFYEFNSEIYDEKVLKDLRDNTCDSDKTLIKKINPFYEEIENIK